MPAFGPRERTQGKCIRSACEPSRPFGNQFGYAARQQSPQRTFPEEDILEDDMEQPGSVPEGQGGAFSSAASLPIWLRHTTRRSPERRRTMLEHITRRRFILERQAAVASRASGASQKSGADFAKDLIGHMIVFGLIGLLLQSRFPIFLGALLFCTDGEFIEWMLQKNGHPA
jgi:hypothetical protein